MEAQSETKIQSGKKMKKKKQKVFRRISLFDPKIESKLFDLKVADKVFGLDNANDDPDIGNDDDDQSDVEVLLPRCWSCSICGGAKFEGLQEQRQHYKLDWHR